MRKAYFCYEMDKQGHMKPCIYYDNKPGKLIDFNPVRLSLNEIPSKFIVDDEVSLSFAQLERMFPLPERQNDATEILRL